MPVPPSVSQRSNDERHPHDEQWDSMLDASLKRLVAMATHLVGGRVGLLYERAGEQMAIRTGGGPDFADTLRGTLSPLSMSDPFVQQLQQMEGPAVFADAAAHPSVRASALVAGPWPMRFIGAVPVVVRGATRGMLVVGDRSPRALGSVARDELVRLMADWAQVVTTLMDQQQALRARDRVEWEYLRYKNRHETHIENTPVAFMQWNPDFEVTGWNPAAESIFGYSAAEALGRNIGELIIPPALRSQVQGMLRGLLAENEQDGRHNINENRTKEGRTILCEWYNTPLKDENGTVYGGISLALDITDRVEAQEALEERERDLAVTLNSIGDAVIATDAEGNITRMNPMAEALTGWTIADARGTSIDEVVRVTHAAEAGSRAAPFEELFEKVVDEGRVHNGTHPMTLVRRDDTRCQITESMAPIRTADGVVRGTVLVFSDATAQHRREQELREAREIAEEMNQLKSAFLANMSHEIRTPLTTIIGFAEIVEEETRSADEVEQAGEFAKMIRRSGQRLLETINSVLDLSRLEAGTVHLHPSETDVRHEVCETVDLFRPRFADADIRLTVEVPEEPLPAVIDPTGLHRILVNLIGNAIKFTDPGGEITVRASGSDTTLVLAVEDTGVGIDPAFVPDLFEAFKQETTGQNRLHEGSGLGLTITHQLVELMGGTIEVESKKGVGTMFTVRLPRHATVA